MSTVEEQAASMGWAPKEEFRGDPEKWIDAETYVKRGEELMPILRANNKRQAAELEALRTEVKATKDLLAASAESIEALKEFNSNVTRKEAEVKGKELKEALVEAKREGDVEKEVELTDQLNEHRAALKEAERTKTPEVKATPKVDDPTQNPEWQAWQADNTWFGKDRKRTALALGIADELKADPETSKLAGRALLDRVSEEVDKFFGGGAPRHDKVEGGSRGSSGGNGKGYADLPADAKEACERQAQRLVGEGRAFKTTADWRNHYAKQYHGEA
jgi:hypothetical protein